MAGIRQLRNVASANTPQVQLWHAGGKQITRGAREHMRLHQYLSQAFRWQRGRQQGGYDKMLLATGRWPIKFDSYLIRYPVGASIAPHVDPVGAGRHYRLNIVIWRSPRGGEFICRNPIFETSRIKLFRPDACEHSVTRVEGGSRYVFSVGWIRD